MVLGMEWLHTYQVVIKCFQHTTQMWFLQSANKV